VVQSHSRSVANPFLFIPPLYLSYDGMPQLANQNPASISPLFRTHSTFALRGSHRSPTAHPRATRLVIADAMSKKETPQRGGIVSQEKRLLQQYKDDDGHFSLVR
jgi:hypothetical protein